MEYKFNISKASIYINTKRKTLAEIKAETGADVIINGGLYDMTKFIAYCHLKSDGYMYAEDKYSYFGFGWNNEDTKLQLVAEYEHLDNYICCVAMIKDGKALNLIYGDALSGKRGRTAIGTMPDGKVAVFCSKDGSADAKTPEQLQNYLLDQGWANAVMLDGGGSSQCITPETTIESARIVHNVLCFWIDKPIAKDDDTMFKLVLSAGHGINTAGKRCMKALDPNETREWWLNDRVCDYITKYLKEYDGFELLRVDDYDDGKDNPELSTRTKAANDWKADFYLSIHHNAGANGTTAGGIVAFSHPNASAESVAWRNDLYDALIKHTGLKGNRATPKTTADFQVLRETKMPAVLLELGFMDSKTDVPVILTDDFADNCGKAIVEVIAKRAGLKKKATSTKKIYRVQVGAFSTQANAENLAKELEAMGYQTIIKNE